MVETSRSASWDETPKRCPCRPRPTSPPPRPMPTSTHRWDQASMTWNQIAGQRRGRGRADRQERQGPPQRRAHRAASGARSCPTPSPALEYTWKRISHAWDTIEINRIWDPTGSRTVGWVDQTKVGREVFLSATPEDPVTYHGAVDLQRRASLPQLGVRQQLHAGLDHASAKPSATHGFRSSPGATPDQTSGTTSGCSARMFSGIEWSWAGSFSTRAARPLTKGFFNYEQGDYSNQRSPAGTTPGSGTTVNDPTGDLASSAFRISCGWTCGWS